MSNVVNISHILVTFFTARLICCLNFKWAQCCSMALLVTKTLLKTEILWMWYYFLKWYQICDFPCLLHSAHKISNNQVYPTPQHISPSVVNHRKFVLGLSFATIVMWQAQNCSCQCCSLSRYAWCPLINRC